MDNVTKIRIASSILVLANAALLSGPAVACWDCDISTCVAGNGGNCLNYTLDNFTAACMQWHDPPCARFLGGWNFTCRSFAAPGSFCEDPNTVSVVCDYQCKPC